MAPFSIKMQFILLFALFCKICGGFIPSPQPRIPISVRESKIRLWNSLNPIFRNWNCIGLVEKIDFSKPYKLNVGDLPLVVWKNPVTNRFSSLINICKHMGSRLDNGAITDKGCLKCQYHGLEHSGEDHHFGETVEHEGKLFWAYKPLAKMPPRLPFFSSKQFTKSFLEFDMDGSFTDGAFNTMDLYHPEYVHGGVLGFGNSIPPKNIKHYKFSANKIGLAFDYESKQNIQFINSNSKLTNNFHMFEYPAFSWSKVTFDKNKHLVIGVNLLPVAPQKTKWFVTIANNYFTSYAKNEFMKLLATTILTQDSAQMRNQHADDELKRQIMFQHVFKHEESITNLREMFRSYRYPDISSCVELYADSRANETL